MAPLFWAFRIMVVLGVFFIAFFTYFFWISSFRNLWVPRAALWVAVLSIPLPWIAAEMGWFVAEVGRQPWRVEGVLPTSLAVSQLGVWEVALTLSGFVLFYTVLFVVEVALLVKYIRKGPFLDTEAVDAWDEARARRFHRVEVPAAPARTGPNAAGISPAE